MLACLVSVVILVAFLIIEYYHSRRSIETTSLCSKKTILTCGGLGPLQMVLELITERCEALVGIGLDPLQNRLVLKL